MRPLGRWFTASLLVAITTVVGLSAQPPASPPVTVFRNVRVFDGRGTTLTGPTDVVVRGRTIASIGPATPGSPGATVIDGGGRTLMPGLIDAHAHVVFESIGMADGLTADLGYVYAVGVRAAEAQLLRGFTTVRDMGGNTFGLKRAIDEGLVPGPRIYPSGATLSQTGGHGDFGAYNEVPRVPGALSVAERAGMTAIADGPDLVLMRAREQLRQGATQLKVMAGGGVASNFDPLDVTQYTEREFRAAVDAASAWGTYVAVHAYTPQAIATAIAAGVRCIEHGQLMDEATARLMAEKGVWLSLQPFLDDEDAIPFPEGSANRAKQLEMTRGTEQACVLAKKHGVKTAFGTDTLFDARLATRQGAQLAKLTRWYSPAEVLRMATSGNAELLGMSGKRNPYPGTLGVVETGALADLILVDGDPLTNIALIADPQKNFLVIMKDGRVHKNTLRAAR